MTTRAFELELHHQRSIGDFTYSIGGNFTYVKNEITYIDESENIPEWQRRTGRPMGQFFGYVSDGLYMTQEQLDNQPKFDYIEPRLGDIMYRDIDGNGIITPDDQTAIGYSRLPQIMYGINFEHQLQGI